MSQQSNHARHSWRETIGFCAHYWAQERPLLSVVVLLTLVMVAAEVCIPLSAGHLVDTLTKVAAGGLSDESAGQAALMAVGLMTGISAVYYVLGNISTRVYHRAAARCMAKVIEDGFARIVAERPAQCADGLAEGAVGHDHVGPDLVEDVSTVDRVTATFDE
jgi:ATP-binding cassette subfamily B protein